MIRSLDLYHLYRVTLQAQTLTIEPATPPERRRTSGGQARNPEPSFAFSFELSLPHALCAYLTSHIAALPAKGKTGIDFSH